MHLPVWGRLLSPRTSLDWETQGMDALPAVHPLFSLLAYTFSACLMIQKFFFIVRTGELPSFV
jgi:hypothetical protein